MILPNKYVTMTESFFGLSALLLDILDNKILTVDTLWNKFQKKYVLSEKIKVNPTYQKFIYVLEFMYLTGMITHTDEGEIFNENLRIGN